MKAKKPPVRLKKRLMAGALSVAVLALSGCMKVEAGYEFYEDNTATMTMITTDLMDNQLFTSEDECTSFVEELSLDEIIGGTESTPEDNPPVDKKHEFFTDDDGRNGCRVQISNVPVPVVSEEQGITWEEDAEGGIRRVGDEFLVSFTEASDELGDSEAMEEMGIPPTEIFFQLTFPGEVTEHTAGELANDGRTVVFEDFIEATKEPIEIRASAVPSSGSSLGTIITIAVGVILVLGVVLGGLFLIKRNRNDEDDKYDEDDDDDYDDRYARQQAHYQQQQAQQGIPTQQGYDGQGFAAPGAQQYAPQQQQGFPQQQHYAEQYQTPQQGDYGQNQEHFATPQQQDQFQDYDDNDGYYSDGEEEDFLPPPPPPPPPIPTPQASPPAPTSLPQPSAPQMPPREQVAPQGLPKPGGGLPGAPKPTQGNVSGKQVKKLPPLPPPPPRFK